MSDGQIALNTAAASAGLFFKDSNGDLVKTGPVHIGTTAPNSTPATGGSTGNSKGEAWLDTSNGNYVLKIYDGTSWQSVEIAPGSARQLLQTNAAGTDVEFTSNVDVPGTLDVTGATTLDSTASVAGLLSADGKISFAEGNSAAPGIYPGSDTDTGISSPSLNELSFSTAGTSRLYIDSSGQIGIGTTTASYALDVRSGDGRFKRSASNEAAIYLGNTSNNYIYGTSDANLITLGTNGSEKLRIASDGNVGVGTSTDLNQKLCVQGTSNDTIDETQGTAKFEASGGNGLLFGTFASSPYQSYIQSAYVQDTSVGQYSLLLNPLGGNVGIGTTSPSQLLDLASTAPNIRFTDTVDGHSEIDGNAANLKFNADKGNAKADSNITFAIDNSERMRITSSGNVGIGSSAPGAKLHLVDSGQATPALNTSSSLSLLVADGGSGVNNGGSVVFGAASGSWRFAAIKGLVTDGANNTQGDLAFLTRDASTDTTLTERMRIHSSGSIRIGQTTSDDPSGTNVQGVAIKAGYISAAMDNANAAVFGRRGSDGGCVLFRRQTTNVGSITVTGSSTSFNTSSDHRLKENVVDIADGIIRVKQLAPKRFNFIADAATTVDGFLAHEAQAVVPEAVTGTYNEVDDDGNAVMQGIDQSKFVPLLTAALQEAITKIEILEQRLTDAGL